MPQHGIDIIIDGKRENSSRGGDDTHSDTTRSIPGRITREFLAAKPIKYALKDGQRWLCIGYDLAAGHLTMKHHGIDAKKLPTAAKSLQICQNKTVDTSTNDIRYI